MVFKRSEAKKTMLNIFKKKWVIIGIIVAVVIIAGYFLTNKGEEPKYVLAEVTKGEIIQTVSVTGSIKADPTIDLHFQKGGKVSQILVKEGERVSDNQTLASLANRSLELEIKRNKANVSYANAQYTQTKTGAKAEEIKISEAEVDSANASYDAALSELDNTKTINQANIELAEIAHNQAEDNAKAAEKDLETTTELAENEIAKLELGGVNTQTVALDSAYSKARTSIDIALTSMQDSLFLAEDILGVRGTGFFFLSESKKRTILKNYYEPANSDYENAASLYSTVTLSSTDEEIDAVMTETVNAGNGTSLLLTQIGTELQSHTHPGDDLKNKIKEVSTQSGSLSNALLGILESQATIQNIKTGTGQDSDTLKLNYELQIDAAQNVYNTALNSLEKAKFDLEQAKLNAENGDKNAEAQVAIKKAAKDSAIARLDLIKSPVRSVDLAPLLAQISLAKVAQEIAENEYRDSQLISPIDGVVTFIHGKVGENISISETALSSFLSIQADTLLVEANVPETDISKIESGDKVEMTIDAFDFTEKFNGTVVNIDRAETIIQGVVYYEIQASFDLEDDRLKSGMTTNLDIIADKKENVLTIPARAIKYEDSIRYVEVLNNGTPKKTTIETGLESDQYVEVTSGLNEGDKIITFAK